MVRSMHAAGIEVILDVVYNHTAEGNHLGPTLSFKGIDNPAYYRLVEDDLRYYMDYTGTGNSLNVRHPHSLQLIMDSLRYWVTEMHVDGFRFDLAVGPGAGVLRRRPAVDVLRARAAGPGRQPGEADRGAVGRRPRRLPGRRLPAAVDRVERQAYRDTVRDFWRGEPSLGRVRQPARRVERPLRAARVGDPSPRSTSSPPMTASHCATWCPTTTSTTRPTARTTTTARATTARGTTASRARPTTPTILALRARQQRNFLATLLLSQGVPMLLHGDEVRPHPGRQQQHLRPGRPDLLAALGRRRQPARRVHRRASPSCAASTRRSAAAASSPARRCAPERGRAAQRHRLAAPRRPADGGRRLERARRAVDRDVPQRPRHRRPGRPRPHDQGRPLPALLQRRRPTTYR